MLVNSRLLRFAVTLSGVIVLFAPSCAAARQTTVTGSLGMGYNYWERTYKDENVEDTVTSRNEGDRRDWSVWPEIELRSSGIHDLLSLRYRPVLTYDDLRDTTYVDHYLTLAGQRFLTRNWNVSLSNNFVLSTDPTRDEAPFARLGHEGPAAGTPQGPTTQNAEQGRDTQLTRNLGRRRYWTNDLTVRTNYTYAEDSDMGVGYTYDVLRNESGDNGIAADYEEYDRHDFSGLFPTGSTRRGKRTWNSIISRAFIMIAALRRQQVRTPLYLRTCRSIGQTSELTITGGSPIPSLSCTNSGRPDMMTIGVMIYGCTNSLSAGIMP